MVRVVNHSDSKISATRLTEEKREKFCLFEHKSEELSVRINFEQLPQKIQLHSYVCWDGNSATAIPKSLTIDQVSQITKSLFQGLLFHFDGFFGCQRTHLLSFCFLGTFLVLFLAESFAFVYTFRHMKNQYTQYLQDIFRKWHIFV